MERFIPYEKLSKKNRRERDAARRVRWERSPVTRRPANPKAYNRKKARKDMSDEPSVFFVPRYERAGYFFNSPGRTPKQSRKARWNTE